MTSNTVKGTKVMLQLTSCGSPARLSIMIPLDRYGLSWKDVKGGQCCLTTSILAQAPMQNCTGLSLLWLLHSHHSLQDAMPFSALSICIALRHANQTSAQTVKPTNGLAQTALTRVSDTMGKEQPFPAGLRTLELVMTCWNFNISVKALGAKLLS